MKSIQKEIYTQSWIQKSFKEITLSETKNPKAWFGGLQNVHSIVDGIVVDGTVVVWIGDFFLR